ncbi:MAG: twin-arginine translocation signal domain-containing protein [Thermodesulfovibrionales bacterium]
MQSIKITRRQFLKWLSASAAALGLSQSDLLKLEKHLQAAVMGCDAGFPLNALIPGHPGTLARVIWIAGAACSGCPTSILNYIADTADPDLVLNAIANNAIPGYQLVDIGNFYPVSGGPDGDIDIAEVVLEIITIDWAQIIMATSGDIPNQHLMQLRDDGGYILLVEGTIQTASNGKYCRIMDVPGYIPKTGKPWEDYMEHYNDPDLGPRTDVTMAGGTLWLAENALAVVTLGTCAAYGGVPAAKKSVTGGMGAYQWINMENGMGKLMVNIPGCPPNSDWVIATVGAALLEIHGIIPGILFNNLDTSSCITVNGKTVPRLTYTGVYHRNEEYVFCMDDPRRDMGSASTLIQCQRSASNPKGRCMKQKGCNGWIAGPAHIRPDCPTRMWNPIETGSGLKKNNWCVLNNMPCQGCASPGFPDYCSPFYEQNKGSWRGYSYIIPPS